MSHLNGVITAPVDVPGDIGYVLGTGSGDVGFNFRSSAIKKWAKNKPYRSSSHTTDANARKAANYGLSCIDYFSPTDAMTGAKGGSDGWSYALPRGVKNTAINPTNNNEWYRVLDFDGYNHNAATPYRISGMPRPSVYGEKIIAVTREDGSEIKIEDFPPNTFGDDSLPDLSNVYVYLLVNKQTAGTLTICHPTGGDIALAEITSGTSTINFTIPSSLANTNDTYHLLAVASTWTDDGEMDVDEAKWVLLPGTYEAAVINDQDYILGAEYYDNDSRLDFAASINNSTLSLNIDAVITNENFGLEIGGIALYLEVTEKQGDYYERRAPIGYGQDVFVLTHGPSDDFDGWRVQINNQYLTDSGDISKMYVRLWYSYTGASPDTYTYWRYFDFDLRGGGSNSFIYNQPLSNVPHVAINDILNL